MRKFICLVIISGIIIVVFYFFQNKEASVTIVNHTPYPVKYAMAVGTISENLNIRGWYLLEPGERNVFSKKYKLTPPSFFVHAQSTKPSLIKWIYDLNDEDEGVVYFDDDFAQIEFFNVENNEFEYDLRKKKEELLPSLTTAGFVKVSYDKNNNGLHVIYDNSFEGFLTRENIANTKNALDDMSHCAKSLSISFNKQVKFRTTFKNPTTDFPFHLGVQLDDSNGFDYPGVEIKEILISETIDGATLPYETGDVILSLNTKRIFSYGDLLYEVFEHAVSKNQGIKIPIEMELIRNGELLRVKTSYFFNENYYQTDAKGKIKAIGYGVGDAAFYGKAPVIVGATKSLFKTLANVFKDKNDKMEKVDYYTHKWNYEQKEMMYRQFHSKQFKGGGIAGMFASPAHAFTRIGARSLTKIGMSKKSSYLASAVGIEMAEGLVWSYNTAPVIITKKEKLERFKNDIPIILGVGIISGTLLKNSKI